VADAGGRPVAVSLTFRPGRVVHSGCTCPHPDPRWQGRATLTKTTAPSKRDSSGWLIDPENPALRRANERLGYRTLRAEVQFALSGSGLVDARTCAVTQTGVTA
jgi:hypothetical protein